jgi:hypothetical protein
MSINVVFGVALGSEVDSDRVLRELAHETLFAKVCLPTATHVIARGATDEASLRVPIGGLAIVAAATTDVYTR